MSRSARRAISLALVLPLLAGTIGSIAPSWACVPMAKLVSLKPGSSGPAGSRLVVNGLAFGQSPIEVRWDAPYGRLLGSAKGPDFSTRVRIPKVPDGLYTLIVLERRQDGSIGNAATAPFEVTVPGDGRAGGGRGSAEGDGAASGSRSESSSEPSWLALAAGGFALVLLGALGGALIRRLRPRRT